jgi:Tol biopolymer transport system component/predicted Ser/Thr protein kinase
MNPERFARMKEILLQVLDLPEGERGPFLDQVCAGDPELLAEVRNLLAHDVWPDASPWDLRAAPLASATGTSESQQSAGAGATPDTLVRESESVPRWGNLTLRRKLGAGSFGDVYLAFDPDLDREVAVKIYRHAADRAALLKEGRLLARVRHPNVIVVHRAEEHDGRVGLWMETIRGRTLYDLVRKQGLFSPQEAVLIGLDLCRALAAVHARGLIHQDVKAQNVMREDGGRIVLMDFGVGAEAAAPPPAEARTQAAAGDITDEAERSLSHSAPLTVSPSASGTPVCMAPEQLLRGVRSVQTDIYALGVLLHYLVTGRYPVEGSTLAELAEAHRAGRRLLLRDLRPQLPEDFIAVIDRALAARPEGRFASMGEMERALAAILGRSGSESDGDTAARNRRRADLRLRPSVLGALFVLAAIGGLGYFLGGVRAHRFFLPGHSRARSRPLTENAEGNPVIDAAISPDGTLLAYSDRDGLYIKDIATARSDMLGGFGEGRARRIQWYPDQKRLLVWCADSSADSPASYVISLLAGARERLSDAAVMLLPPDSRRYASARDETTMVITDSRDGRESVLHPHPRAGPGMVNWVSSPTGDRWLEPFAGPSASSGLLWERNGRVVFASRSKTEPRGIDLSWVRVDPRSGHPSGRPHHILTFHDEHFPKRLTGSTDGTRLASLQSLVQSEVFAGELDGGGLRPGSIQRLTESSAAETPAAWTADGCRLVVGSTRDGTEDIFLLDRDGGTLAPLVCSTDRREFDPCLSPDGRSLLYLSAPRREASARPESVALCVVPVGGGTPRLIRETPASSSHQIVRAAGPPGLACILADAHGDTVTFHELNPQTGLGRKVAEYELERKTAAHARDPGNAPDVLRDFAVSPNLDALALVGAGGDRITLLEPKTGTHLDLPMSGISEVNSIAWSPDGRWLYVAGRKKPRGQWAIFRLDRAGRGGVIVEAPPGEDGQIYRPVVSPDGTRLAFSREVSDANVWLIEGD